VATRDRDGWILNGGKKWTGLAPYAAFNVVLAKLDHDGRDAETVALVIDLESDGITRSGPLDFMSFRGMPLGELTFNDVKVPATLAASDSFALGRGGDPILLSKAKLFSTDAAMRTPSKRSKSSVPSVSTTAAAYNDSSGTARPSKSSAGPAKSTP
jgi:hypothetical protein